MVSVDICKMLQPVRHQHRSRFGGMAICRSSNVLVFFFVWTEQPTTGAYGYPQGFGEIEGLLKDFGSFLEG